MEVDGLVDGCTMQTDGPVNGEQRRRVGQCMVVQWWAEAWCAMEMDGPVVGCTMQTEGPVSGEQRRWMGRCVVVQSRWVG